MTRLAYVGTPVTAAGYRLAGLEVHCPEPVPAAIFATLEQCRDEGVQGLLLALSLARRLDPQRLAEWQARAQPVLAVVPEIDAPDLPPEVAPEIRAVLGIES